MKKDEVVGVWSADALYMPGPSDEIIYFMESGDGWVEYLNWSLCSIETFKWWRSADGKLHIQSNMLFEDHKTSTEIDELHANLDICIQQGMTKTNQPITILSALNADLFGNDKYGLLSSTIESDYFSKRLSLLRDE
ncbi:hypothetical protein [Paenibacillus paridis]|uniref:hypothetical protein n=1 Tax=Paenibacillus paridis TaxID=2583376 RepID=UPI00112038E5|nr:hypothetical protein [Paenibacillus paridis]